MNGTSLAVNPAELGASIAYLFKHHMSREVLKERLLKVNVNEF